MKLVFRQYLASLRERRELDAVLPDLLSELGYTVISRQAQALSLFAEARRSYPGRLGRKPAGAAQLDQRHH